MLDEIDISSIIAIIYMGLVFIGIVCLMIFPIEHKMNKIFKKIIPMGLIISLTVIFFCLICKLIKFLMY